MPFMLLRTLAVGVLFSCSLGFQICSAAAPTLTIQQLPNSQLQINWPGDATGFSLEQADTLNAPVAWQTVTAAVVQNGGVFSVAVPSATQTRFYRLRQTAALPTGILETSPANGESGVAVTRETIFRFDAPLAADMVLDSESMFAEFGGRHLLARPELSSDRKTATLFYLENLPASARMRVTLNGAQLRDSSGKPLDADGDGQPGGKRVLEFNTSGISGLPGTTVTGRVFASEKNPDGSNKPLANVTVTVDGAEESLRATTDSTGSFKLDPAPAGRFFVHVDGRTAVGSQWPGGAYYPFVGKAWEAVAGKTDNLAGGNGEIYLPLVQSDALKTLSATEATTITFSPTLLAANPALAGVEVNVPANALFSDNGARGGKVGMAPVPPDRLPEPLPPGLNLPLVITIQTDGGSNFDRPVPVKFPNLPDPVTGVKLGPGAKTALWSFNHDMGRWEIQGTCTISADGNFAVSDPGVGIRQPGWHGVAGGSSGSGPKGKNGSGSGPNSGNPDPNCEGEECEECTQEITCVTPKGGKNVAHCALECLGDVVDDIFGDGEKPERTAFETGLRCIGGPGKCPGRPEDTLDRKRRGCMDECTDPLPNRKTFVVPCEGFSSPCAAAAALHQLSGAAAIADVLPDRLVEQRKLWEVEGEFLIQLTGTAKILESESSEVSRITALFDALADRVQAASPAGIHLSAAERSELLALPRPAQFSGTEWAAMIDRLDSLQGAPLPADLAAADKQLTDLTAELKRRGWLFRGDGLLDGLTRRSWHSAPEVGGAEFPARSHFYYLKNHRNGFVQRGRLNVSGQFEGLILAPGGYYSVAYLDPVTRRMGAAFFQARQTGAATSIPTTPLIETTTDGDADADGLADAAEKILGTSPANADSDGDGIKDGQELALGSNPLDGVGLPVGVVSATPTPGAAYDVAAGNNLAVLACTGGVAVFDVSNPQSPLQVAVIPGNSSAVALRGSAALAAFGDGVRLIDLSTPASPKVLWLRGDLAGAQAVAFGGTETFVAKGADLFRIDLVTGNNLGILRSDGIESLITRGDLVYLLAPGKLTVCRAGELFDVIRTLAAPGDGGAGGRPRRLFLEGQLLYAQHNFGFNVFDLTDPTAPLLANNVETPQAGWRQIVSTGTGLALAAVGPNSTADGPHDVSLYRLITGGTIAEFVSTFVTPGEAYAVAIAGGRGYVADGASGLTVVNFLAPDLAGIPPSVGFSVDSNSTPPRVEGGTVARIAAIAKDDIAVRQVEFLIDGSIVAQDDNHPFEIFHRIPRRQRPIPHSKPACAPRTPLAISPNRRRLRLQSSPMPHLPSSRQSTPRLARASRSLASPK